MIEPTLRLVVVTSATVTSDQDVIVATGPRLQDWKSDSQDYSHSHHAKSRDSYNNFEFRFKSFLTTAIVSGWSLYISLPLARRSSGAVSAAGTPRAASQGSGEKQLESAPLKLREYAPLSHFLAQGRF